MRGMVEKWKEKMEMPKVGSVIMMYSYTITL